MNKKKFQKRKERERAVRKKILARRLRKRAEDKKQRLLQMEEAAATRKDSPELDKIMADWKNIANT